MYRIPIQNITATKVEINSIGFLLIITVDLFFIISPRKIFLQPDIEADKKVATTHFLNLQLRYTMSPVSPGDGYCRVGAATDDRLERQLHSDIEMG